MILSFSGHISTLLTAARMPKFDAAYTEKLEIFYLPTLFFCAFFYSLSESGRESRLPPKNGVPPTIEESKLQAKLTQRLPALYALKQFSQRSRSMHDVA